MANEGAKKGVFLESRQRTSVVPLAQLSGNPQCDLQAICRIDGCKMPMREEFPAVRAP